MTGVLFAAGCLALAGFPPFAMFVSEMFMVLAGVARKFGGPWRLCSWRSWW